MNLDRDSHVIAKIVHFFPRFLILPILLGFSFEIHKRRGRVVKPRECRSIIPSRAFEQRARGSHSRLHPWLAGAQYRTTAVVLVYRLISLIGPHCPASTYSSTCPSLSMHFAVHTLRKRRRKETPERDKLRERVCTHGRRCSAIGALFAKCLLVRLSSAILRRGNLYAAPQHRLFRQPSDVISALGLFSLLPFDFVISLLSFYPLTASKHCSIVANIQGTPTLISQARIFADICNCENIPYPRNPPTYVRLNAAIFLYFLHCSHP